MNGWIRTWELLGPISDLICSQAKYRSDTRHVRSVPTRANSGGGECPVRAVQCPQCAADSGYNIRQAADKLSRVQVLAEITRHHTGSVLCHRSQCEKLWLNRENCCSLMLSCCQWNAAEIRINDLCLKREVSIVRQLSEDTTTCSNSETTLSRAAPSSNLL